MEKILFIPTLILCMITLLTVMLIDREERPAAVKKFPVIISVIVSAVSVFTFVVFAYINATIHSFNRLSLLSYLYGLVIANGVFIVVNAVIIGRVVHEKRHTDSDKG